MFQNSNYLAQIRQAGINGQLRSSRFRSVCWKVMASRQWKTTGLLHENCIPVVIGVEILRVQFLCQTGQKQFSFFVGSRFIWTSCQKIRLGGSVEPRSTEPSMRRSRRRYVCAHMYVALTYVSSIRCDTKS